jgi:hypothetical protein
MRHGADSEHHRLQALLPGLRLNRAATADEAVSAVEALPAKQRSDARHDIAVPLWCPSDDTGSKLA